MAEVVNEKEQNVGTLVLCQGASCPTEEKQERGFDPHLQPSGVLGVLTKLCWRGSQSSNAGVFKQLLDLYLCGK